MNNLKINKNSLLSFLICFWLSLFNLVVFLDIDNKVTQQFVFLICILIYFVQFGFNCLKINLYNSLIILSFVIVIIFSLLANFDSYIVFLALLNFIVFSLFLSTYATYRSDIFKNALKKYSLINLILLFIFIFKSGFNLDSRSLIDGVHPNYIGLICMTSSLSAILFDKKIIKYFLMVTSLCITYLVSSRASMLCILLALILIVILDLKENKKYIIPIVISFACLVTFYYQKIIVSISEVFMLDDEYRGVGSGLSGRSDRWDIAFDLIEKNLIFGVGFKMGESLLGFTTDNGYISVLLELGIVGFFAFLSMIIIVNFYAIKNLFKNNALDNHFSSIVILIFTVYMFFEQRYINFGNALAFIFYFCVFNILSFKKTHKL